MRHGILIAGVALAGCGANVDVPENIPARGIWRKDAAISRVAVNGLTLPREQLPVALPPDEHEELGCIEPALRTLADLQRVVAERSRDQCELTAMTHAGAAIAGNGRCKFGEKGDMGGLFTLSGEERADTITLHQATDVFVRAPGGATDQVRMAATVVWKRLGDC